MSAPPEVALGRAARCQLCRQPHRADGALCWDHHRELVAMLDPDNDGDVYEGRAASIAFYFERLDAGPRTTGLADRRAPGFHSSPPLSLHTVVLRDDRSHSGPVAPVWYPLAPGGGDDLDRPHHEQPGEPRPVLRTLATFALDLWQHLGVEGPDRANGDVVGRPSVDAICGWLHGHVDAITRHPAAGVLFRYLAELHNDLRVAAGDPRDRSVGRCIALVRAPGGQEEQQWCDTPLYLPPPLRQGEERPAGPVLRCVRCYRPYTELDLLRLQLDAELTGASS